MDMKNVNNIYDIPADKFKLANRSDTLHDKKLDTKPLTYFQDAFRRFCKNKGAVVGGIVISFLVLFAIIAPFFTPYTPADHDKMFAYVTPKLPIFEESGLDFWDGYKERTNVNYLSFMDDYALGLEIGQDIIKNGEYTVSEDGTFYTYRYDTYHGVGFGKYKKLSMEEYLDIQEYQKETGRQVLYPIVHPNDRPTHIKNNEEAKYYYVMENPNSATLRPKLDADGNIQVNYWKYKDGTTLSSLIVPYDSTRIEGEDGVQKNGDTYYYVYGMNLGGSVQVRTERYEYYVYQQARANGSEPQDPIFIFGTTDEGKDIFACLAYGARFSFVFALLVAVVNLVVGVIWGSISGYYGGKIDMAMERFVEILGAVPTMIVITLLKYHMGATSHVIVLFISFFATGWIGMAGRTRMQFYRFKNQEYVLTARTLGASDKRIMFKHIFPNAIGTLVTSCALIIPSMIYSETSLSYLGIINLEAGETTSVGTLINAGQKAIIIPGAGYVALFPCVFLVLLMLSFNLFGNGLRDAFNPSLRGTEE